MGWLDVINIGIDAAQSAQLAKARGEIKKMEERQMQEAVRKEILDNLRNLIFASQKASEALEVRLEKSPLPVYVGARLLEYRLTDLDVTPEIFPDFTDKEYVHKAQSSISRLKKNSKAKLVQKQITKAEECVTAIVEMPLLNDALDWKKAEKLLQDTESDWKRQSGRKTMFRLGAVGALVVAVPLACLSLIASVGTSNSSLQNLGCLGGFALPVVGLIGAIFLFAVGSGQIKGNLAKDREEAAKTIPDDKTQEMMKEKFGPLEEKDLKSLSVDRGELIQGVMGEVMDSEDYDRFLLTD